MQECSTVIFLLYGVSSIFLVIMVGNVLHVELRDQHFKNAIVVGRCLCSVVARCAGGASRVPSTVRGSWLLCSSFSLLVVLVWVAKPRTVALWTLFGSSGHCRIQYGIPNHAPSDGGRRGTMLRCLGISFCPTVGFAVVTSGDAGPSSALAHL